jgi:hypothetical protein
MFQEQVSDLVLTEFPRVGEISTALQLEKQTKTLQEPQVRSSGRIQRHSVLLQDFIAWLQFEIVFTYAFGKAAKGRISVFR